MSGLIVIKTKDAASLPMLYRLVLSHVFAPKENLFLKDVKYTPSERDRLMENSFEVWAEKLRLNEDKMLMAGFEDPALIWERDMVQMMAKMLVDNEKGLHNKTKWVIKEHKLDYRKIFRLKEAFTAEGFFKGQQAYEKYKAEHPELEDGSWN